MAEAGPSGRSPVVEALRDTPMFFRELMAGSLAGITGKTCVAPLERAKILFQTGRLTSGSLAATLAAIYRHEGFSGLFRGNGASVLRIVPYSAIHFTAYEHYRRLLVEHVMAAGPPGRSVPPVWDLAAGAGAGASAVLVTYPLDLVRTRLAYTSEAAGEAPRPRYLNAPGGPSAGPGAQNPAAPWAAATPSAAPTASTVATPAAPSQTLPPKAPPARARLGIGAMLATTLRHEGLRGAYHGVGASMYGILPYAGLKFYVYQSLKQQYHHRAAGASTAAGDGTAAGSTPNPGAAHPRLPVPVMLTFGGLAGLVAQTATYPFDVVRRRMQVEALQLESLHAGMTGRLSTGGLALRSTPQALLLIARVQGWRTLFVGLSINYLKVVPSTAIGFTVYDHMKHLLALPSNL